MGKFSKDPEIIAAVISVIGTVIGTLLISIILGFLEGRIGLGPVVIVVAFLLLLTILVLLFIFWGPRRAGVTSAAMVAIGSVLFLVSAFLGLIPERLSSVLPKGTDIPEPTQTLTTTPKSITSPTYTKQASPTEPFNSPTPASTATAVQERKQVYDDFSLTEFDGGVNSTIWSLQGPASVEVKQEEGRMVIRTLTQGGSGPVELTPIDSQSWSWGQLKRFQADLKLDSSRAGDGGLLKIQIVIPMDRTDDWWVECQLNNSDPDHAVYFCNYYNGGPWVWPEGYEYYTEMVNVDYDVWVTARIEIDPDLAQISFFLDDNIIGSHQLRDVEELQKADYYPLVGSWIEVGDNFAGAWDNVSIGP